MRMTTLGRSCASAGDIANIATAPTSAVETSAVDMRCRLISTPRDMDFDAVARARRPFSGSARLPRIVSSAYAISARVCHKRKFWAVSNIASPPAEGLQLKPRHRQIDASNHRECGNDTYPPGPHGLGPATSQQHSNNAEHGCPNRGRGDPAVPVYRRRKEPQRGVGHVSCMVRPRQYDTERRKNGEQCQILGEGDHVEDRERRPERKCEAAE